MKSKYRQNWASRHLITEQPQRNAFKVLVNVSFSSSEGTGQRGFPHSCPKEQFLGSCRPTRRAQRSKIISEYCSKPLLTRHEVISRTV